MVNGAGTVLKSFTLIAILEWNKIFVFFLLHGKQRQKWQILGHLPTSSWSHDYLMPFRVFNKIQVSIQLHRGYLAKLSHLSYVRKWNFGLDLSLKGIFIRNLEMEQTLGPSFKNFMIVTISEFSTL